MQPRYLGLLLVGILLSSAGCSQDPATTVTIELTGISDDADRDTVQETLKEMTDGNSHSMRTFSTGNSLTVHLSPVSDVDAFVNAIDFGEVTDVNGRTVKVTYRE